MKRLARRHSSRQLGIEPLEARAMLSATWSSVELTGGGYLTGIHVHPTDPDIMYARTDVGGIYKVDPAAGRMNQLFDWITPEEDNLYGVAGLALHPTDTDIVYAALGKYEWEESHGVYKSEDAGETWEDVGIDVTFDANWDAGRWGTRLAFNPHNPDQMLVGSYGDGLWRHIRSSGSTARLSSVVVDSNDRVQAIVFDPNSPNDVYVAVDGRGVYRSSAGLSNSFVLMPGSPVDINDMELSRDSGSLVIANDTGLFRLDNPAVGGSWTNVSPLTGGPHYTVDFSPHDDDTLITSRGGYDRLNTVSISTDTGDTWRRIWSSNVEQTSAWMPQQFPGSSISDFAWDPVDPDRVHFTDWYSLWETSDINAPTVTWSNPNATGHSELVGLALAVPRSSNSDGIELYTGFADVGAFRHVDIEENPEFSSLTNGPFLLIDITGIGVSDEDPDRVYLVGIDKNSFSRPSLDGSFAWWSASQQTWVESAGYDPTWGFGRVAVSNGDADKLVVATSHGGVRYSTDGGQTFQAASGAPTSAEYRLEIGQVWTWSYSLAADGGPSDAFYLYSNDGGRFYRSTDGGANWSVVNQSLPQPGEWRWDLKSTPGRADHLWLGLNRDGLLRTADGGVTWQTIGAVQEALLVAVGKAAPDATYETLYIYGKANGDPGLGIFMSTDEGATWQRIGTGEQGLSNFPEVMAADPDRYGVVYVGTNGSGVVVSEIASAEPVTGDYDGNGVVEQADYDVWRANFGATVEPFSGGDGNGDGAVNALDYTIWRDALAVVQSMAPATINVLSAAGDTTVLPPTPAAVMEPTVHAASATSVAAVVTNAESTSPFSMKAMAAFAAAPPSITGSTASVSRGGASSEIATELSEASSREAEELLAAIDLAFASRSLADDDPARLEDADLAPTARQSSTRGQNVGDPEFVPSFLERLDRRTTSQE